MSKSDCLRKLYKKLTGQEAKGESVCEILDEMIEAENLGGGGGGATSWNDLTDKPFYKEEITLNGTIYADNANNIPGVVATLNLYFLSDKILPYLEGGYDCNEQHCDYVQVKYKDGTDASDAVESYGTLEKDGYVIISVKKPCENVSVGLGATFTKTGAYLMSFPLPDIETPEGLAVTIIGKIITPLDVDYFPEEAVTKDSIQNGDFVYLTTDIPAFEHYLDATITEAYYPLARSVGNRAFERCHELKGIIMPYIKTIGNRAFYNCYNLVLTSLPEGLTSIGDEAFSSCEKLVLTNLPAGLTSIGDSAFEFCDGLTSINLPAGLTSIGENAFRSCEFLTTINVPWAEGEVANAPWGATNATINYNYTGE